MNQKQDCRDVFLDTAVFEAEVFNLDSKGFKILKELIADGKVRIVLTDITRSEVLAHIDEYITKALGVLKFKDEKKERAIDILRQFGKQFSCIFEKQDKEALTSELKNRFNAFCDESMVVSSDKIEFARIRDNYFGNAAPFSEGRKKNEFPDAFAAATLHGWVKENDATLHVVSPDPDWKAICGNTPGFLWVENMTEFLALFPDPFIANKIINELMESKDLEDAIEEDFQRLDFYLYRTEGDVTGFNKVDAKIRSVLVTEEDDRTSSVEVIADIKYEAEVEYEAERGVPGRHDDEWYYFPTRRTGVVRDTVTLEAAVQIKHDDADIPNIEIESVELKPRNLQVDIGMVENHY